MQDLANKVNREETSCKNVDFDPFCDVKYMCEFIDLT